MKFFRLLTLLVFCLSCSPIKELQSWFYSKIEDYIDDKSLLDKSEDICTGQLKELIDMKNVHQEAWPKSIIILDETKDKKISEFLSPYKKNPEGLPEDYSQFKELIQNFKREAPEFMHKCEGQIRKIRKSCLEVYPHGDGNLWNCIGIGERALALKRLMKTDIYPLLEEKEQQGIREEAAMTFKGLPEITDDR